ncbi:MAG: hypothetical protein H6983_18155 [Ectothiorhodospiraceae bacterium]|nr:hypothetical protein [Ectothiorhodospiraceae bacterium]
MDLLESLLQYPPALYARGVIELGWGWGTWLAATLVVAVGLGWWLRGLGRRRRDRVVIGLLRAGLVALVLLALARPVLVVPSPRAVQGQVVVLLDDSRSMGIADVDGAPRARLVTEQLAPGAGAVARALEARFDTRYVRYAVDAVPMDDATELRFDGPGSDLAVALERARTLVGAAPAAVVVVGDGGHDGTGRIDDAVLALRAAGVAVYTVGVGAERHALDLELAAVHLPRSVLVEDTVEALVTVRHRGLAGRSARLVVEDGGVLLAEQALTLPPGSETASASVRLEPDEPGPHRLVFRVEAVDGEVVAENNAMVMPLDVRADRLDVLHLEGEPRFEVKFARRAVAEDPVLRLVSLVRTAENKLYRLGVDAPEELAEGFPTTAPDLFRYHAVVLGSVEAAYLTDGQHRLLADFVSRRGGGLLLLGGRFALGEGGWARSPVADLLPVSLGTRDPDFAELVHVLPTIEGVDHPVVRAVDPAAWPRLPPLSVANPVRGVKPGATILLAGEGAGGRSSPVLTWQRYGRGTVGVLPVRNLWRWQMHAEVPAEDLTHERLWRELLRELARPAASPIRLRATPEEPVPGRAVTVEAAVVDAEFRPDAGAEPELVVVTPLGARRVIAMSPATDGEGLYRARFVPEGVGRHDLEVTVERPPLAEGATPRVELAALSVEVTANGREHHGAELARERLERLARATGGRYFPAAEVVARPAALAEAITMPDDGLETTERLPLHAVPALLLAILLLASAEWIWRRRSRLP